MWRFEAERWGRMVWKGTLVMSDIIKRLMITMIHDPWMTREHPDLLWCRYADDGLVHCRTEAVAVKATLAARLAECQLEMHPEKTKVVYCKDGRRRGKHPNTKFDFLGYCFRPRAAINHKHKMFTGFGPQVSASSLKSMRQKIRELKLRKRTQIRLADIAREINQILQGWLNYYGRYNPAAMYPMWRYVNATLVAWAMRKYKRYAGRKIQARMGTARSSTGGLKAGPRGTNGTWTCVARSYNSQLNGLACPPMGMPRYSRLKTSSPSALCSCSRNSAGNVSNSSAVAFSRIHDCSSLAQAVQNGSVRLHAVDNMANRACGRRARIGRSAAIRS